MSTFAQKAIKYFTNIKTQDNLPSKIDIVNPYKSKEVKKVVMMFFEKYFNDSKNRIFVFGINPGRFGGGLTGISFTDPVALRNECDIENNLGTQKELSSKFVYRFINEYGGPEKFYRKYFITALFPLALLKDGKNHNYYDSKELFRSIKPHIIETMKKQIAFGAKRKFAVSLGKKNFEYLNKINDEFRFFEEVRFVEHPRHIMQYRLKKINVYLYKYLQVIKT